MTEERPQARRGPPEELSEETRQVEGHAEDVDLRSPRDEGTHPERKKFGTFGGVFTPTLLTILGVIMFLREGWVIGNAGLLGGLAVILLAFGITILTALSMSSITTNIRIGAGGAYAIIAQSLGLEIGGALGIPRYVSQALAVTMYIFGFREGWMRIFPTHPEFLVDILIFAALFGIAYRSAGFAIRIQYVIMAVIAAALLSVAGGALTGSMELSLDEVQLWGAFPGAPEDGFQGTDFWGVFAVFFPAATGIMAGANMSGDLKEPKKAIPLGTLGAIGVSLVVYVLVAFWLARSATPGELVSDYYIMMDEALWGPPVLAGLLGATFSSALASLVGSARILQAMGEHGVIPRGDWLAERTDIGEPRNALWVTGGVLFFTLFLRDLNAVAPLITMFFLITYAMLNGVLLLEQSLDLVSFRPNFRVPRWVPALGLVGSLFAMFIIQPTVGWVSIAVVLACYWILLRRQLEAPFADMRSGLFVAVAEWAAMKVKQLPPKQERAWKPNVLVPVEEAGELRGELQVLENLIRPHGMAKVFGLARAEGDARLADTLSDLAVGLQDRGVFTDWTIIRSDGFADGLTAGMQALRGAFFRPNIAFLRMPERRERAEEYRRIIAAADDLGVGTMVYAPHPTAGLGQRRYLNVWVRDRSPDWRISWDIGNLDLSILSAYKIARNWDATLRLIMVVDEPSHRPEARDFLSDLRELARLPDPEIVVRAGDFEDHVARVPQGDVSIFGLVAEPDFGRLYRLVKLSASTCLFVRDSGQESVLA